MKYGQDERKTNNMTGENIYASNSTTLTPKGKERTIPYNLKTEKSKVYKYKTRKHKKLELILRKLRHLTGGESILFIKYQDGETILESTVGAAVSSQPHLLNGVFAHLEKFLRFNSVNTQYHLHGQSIPFEPFEVCASDFIEEAKASFKDRKMIPIRLVGLYSAFKALSKESNMQIAKIFSKKSAYLKKGKYFGLSKRWQAAVFNSYASLTILDEELQKIVESATVFSAESINFNDILDARKIWLMTHQLRPITERVEINPDVMR